MCFLMFNMQIVRYTMYNGGHHLSNEITIYTPLFLVDY